MIRFDILTAVPETFPSLLDSSIIRIAQGKGKAEIHIHDLHRYSEDKFGHIDDAPYGGGAGMLLECGPVFKCIEQLLSERNYDHVIYMSPDGKRLEQSDANELSLSGNIIILCGHYKGVDQRIRDLLITREYSVGDYVLSGGELPAMIMMDAIIRLLPGVLGDAESALEDSFMEDLLEPPQYTRPADFRGHKVPEILLSGNPKKIDEWRTEQSIEKTRQRRPDLLEKFEK